MGQILENIDDVAHLMLGYQKYLEFIGWGFTDIDEQGQTVDFEQLLYKFLEWVIRKSRTVNSLHYLQC